jgi:hypothetical protein
MDVALLVRRLAAFDGVDHPSLPADVRDSFGENWAALQERASDEPCRAICEAAAVSVAVLRARHFVIDDYGGVDALSVSDPALATTYRHAHRVFCLAERGAHLTDSTVTCALGWYRDLLEHLLELAPGDLALPRREPERSPLPIGRCVAAR